jgi:acyl-CoA synthetase (AMP-forming)/AMP-acid ligase II
MRKKGEATVIFHSPYPDVDIPKVPVTEYILERARPFADRPALVDGPSGRTYTYRQMEGAIRLVAANLAERGLKKGDVFAIYSPNVPEYAIAFHGISSLGGILTTANPLYTVRELTSQLKDSGARYLLTIPQFLDKAQAAAAQAGIEEIFVFGEAEGATPFATLLKPGVEPPAVIINPREDLIVLPYSSGTTGLPKGVMLTHYNIVANICQVESLGEPVVPTEKDTIIGVLPFYHIYGMVVIINMTLATGATIVTMPRFDLEQFLQIMQDYHVTRVNVVPPMILALAKHPLVDQYDLSSIEFLTSGAAPLGEDLASACADRLNCLVVQGYGLTETSPITHISPFVADKIKLASAGITIPNTETKIADLDTGEALGPNQDGEVWIRGPQVMKGYLNNPEATAATIDQDGWLRTGDIGHMDEDGYLYIVDRLKELIKYKGFQVAPAELEALLLSHPAIADAGVIPSPDEEAGEIPKALVVLKGDITPDEIMAFIAERVAPHKKIRQVEIVDEIPKSLSGKILRRVLIERERG